MYLTLVEKTNAYTINLITLFQIFKFATNKLIRFSLKLYRILLRLKTLKSYDLEFKYLSKLLS